MEGRWFQGAPSSPRGRALPTCVLGVTPSGDPAPGSRPTSTLSASDPSGPQPPALSASAAVVVSKHERPWVRAWGRLHQRRGEGLPQARRWRDRTGAGSGEEERQAAPRPSGLPARPPPPGLRPTHLTGKWKRFRMILPSAGMSSLRSKVSRTVGTQEPR